VDVNGDGFDQRADCAPRASAGLQGKNRFTQMKKSIALYSDLKYKLTDALTVRGGLRYTHDTGTRAGSRPTPGL
jgi:iron complex outermembrane receptor protein